MPKSTAKQTVTKRAAQIRAMAAMLSAYADEVESVENPSWGHAGDLGAVSETLEIVLVGTRLDRYSDEAKVLELVRRDVRKAAAK